MIISLVSFDEVGDYNQKDAEGFIKINSIRLKKTIVKFMGYGDDLLITSLASKIKKQFPDRQIVIGIAAKKSCAYHSPYL